jgi:hypothetical protein
MPHELLIDNWTLQNAGELICNGLDGEMAQDLVFSSDGTSFHYAELAQDSIRFEALCQLLSNIVFADNLYVDAEYVDTWTKFPPIKSVHKEGILVAKSFRDVSDQWVRRREAIADELCFNAALRKKHRANKRSYSTKKKAIDPFLSQLLWGGAGMLARASHFGLPYIPHPSRERLFKRSRFLSESQSAETLVKDFITTQRLKVSEQVNGNGFHARISLPAVAVIIIENSSDIASLMKTAFQVRHDYKSLRNWMGKLQSALDQEDTKSVLSERKVLESVARHLDSCITLTPAGDSTLQIGLSWLRVTTKTGSPANALKNQFGVRAALNRLVLAPAGRNALNKFIRMLGEENTSRGMSFHKAALQNSNP